jgi:1,4-alpha-glucan branching enzyme
MPKGYLCLLLHTHLPFVRHPEEDVFLEESWLFEAITETYIPLLDVMESWVRDGVRFRLAMSLTPTLVSMLRDPLLQGRYLRHIERLVELSEKEIARTETDPALNRLARMYHDRFIHAREAFVDTYGRDLVSGFRRMQDLGHIEILASCATHGFLPNLSVNQSSVRAQIRIGVDHYRAAFGRDARGFWLPECGYYPGVDALLKDAGVNYFILDSHGVLNGEPKPHYSVYAPVFCPTGVAAFGRDWESSKQVWSAQEGFPGNPDYREFYRDIGFELDFDYVKPYIHPQGFRTNTGIKYWKVTGKTEHKELYIPDRARDTAAWHAGEFMYHRQQQVERLAGQMDRKPLITAPYDAELFGHWWYEGPMWIDFLARKIACDQDTIALVTPSEYLAEYPVNQVVTPSASSWGWKGYNEYWLEGRNDWVYPHLHAAGRRMAELARISAATKTGDGASRLLRKAANQAARELVLAEASDWPFIMRTGTMVPYADKRVKQHINRFARLYDDVKKGAIDAKWLAEVQRRDCIFADMECARYYAEPTPPGRRATFRRTAKAKPRRAAVSAPTKRAARSGRSDSKTPRGSATRGSSRRRARGCGAT